MRTGLWDRRPQEPFAPGLFSRRALILTFLGASSLSLGSGLHAAVVHTRYELSRFPPIVDAEVYLRERGREGEFVWCGSDLSLQVAADPLQGFYVAGADGSGRNGAWVRVAAVARPEMFGAGTTGDDTEALQAFLAHLEDNERGLLSGSYSITRELVVRDKRGFTLTGGGVIRAADRMPVQWGYGLIRFAACEAFQLTDLTFDGNRANREEAERPAHSVIFESCRDFTCRKVQSRNAVVDGFILLSETPADRTTHCREFRFIDCVADNCFRQGCSVIQGSDGLFQGGIYKGTNGTAPSAGIDLEPDRGDPEYSISNISFQSVRFEGNEGYGLIVSSVSRARDIEVSMCQFVNNKAGAISWGSETGKIADARVDGFTKNSFRGAIDIPVGAGCRSLSISNPVFTNITATEDKNPLVYVHEGSGGNVVISGVIAESCAAVASFWAPHCKLLDSPLIISDKSMFNGAILIYGDDCEVSRNCISSFHGAVILAVADRLRIESNEISDPRFVDDLGCVNVQGNDAVVRQNRLESKAHHKLAIVLVGTGAVIDNAVVGFEVPVIRR